MERHLRRIAGVLCLLPLMAEAQLLPPVIPRGQAPGRVPLPVPELPAVAELPTKVLPANELPVKALAPVRNQARDLLRRYPDRIERDPRGAPVMRSVILGLGPDAAALQQATARGFVIQDDRTLPALNQR